MAKELKLNVFYRIKESLGECSSQAQLAWRKKE
jgi:hypothetical protein